MTRKKAIIVSAISGVCLAAGCATIAICAIPREYPFRLDEEYYATSESIDIDKDEYEKLIAKEKSFVVMIDKPGCITTSEMRSAMANFSDEYQFKYYRMMWEEVKESSLHEYVKFTPSIAVIHNGKVIDWLDADSDEDAEYYDSAESLQRWLKEYIVF